ncbi:flagellar protein FlaG [Pseudomonas sp. MOB-449]|nr:flagellar protein FlaG [Pseudomonas sp. MOB-449]
MDISKINAMPVGGMGRAAGSGASHDRVSVGEAQIAPFDREAIGADQVSASKESVEAAVSTIQDFTQSIRRSLSFNLDDSTGRVVVKVTDSVSGEVIRQIPSEDALKLAESLEEARSLLFKAEA